MSRAVCDVSYASRRWAIVLSVCLAAGYGLGLCAAPAVAAPGNSGVPTRLNLHNIETRLVQRTNEMRARHGRPPLEIDMGLVNSARRHANWMVRNRRMQHTAAAVAENIAMGQNSSEQVVSDWMNSPGHRANILNPNHRRIGVAAYRAPDGTVYWCQQFMQ